MAFISVWILNSKTNKIDVIKRQTMQMSGQVVLIY